MAIGIYIVEDHALMRTLLIDLIESEPDFSVCGAAATGEEAVEDLAERNVDVVLIDTSLPEMSGIEVVDQVHRRWPELRCVMVSGHAEDPYVERALAAGARGYVLKGTPSELPKAIRQVMSGTIYLSESLLPDRFR